jgi:hypothetical protein
MQQVETCGHCPGSSYKGETCELWLVLAAGVRHCTGQLDRDHTHAVCGSELSASVYHPQPGICSHWLKILLHFRHASAPC